MFTLQTKEKTNGFFTQESSTALFREKSKRTDYYMYMYMYMYMYK